MTQRQKKSWSVWVTISLFAIGVVWRSSALASDVTANSEDVINADAKATQALVVAVEIRTLYGTQEETIEELKEEIHELRGRMDAFENLGPMIIEIHDVIVGGEQ